MKELLVGNARASTEGQDLTARRALHALGVADDRSTAVWFGGMSAGIAFVLQSLMVARDWARNQNSSMFKHSSRRRPLKDSMERSATAHRYGSHPSDDSAQTEVL